MNEIQENTISFIIPTLNESKYIGNTIAAITTSMNTGSPTPYEIIVIDNGSNDNTIEIAASNGAITIFKPNVTIAALRNIGAKASSGRYLAFIDADVALDISWHEEFKNATNDMSNDLRSVTGSRCLSKEETFLAKFWFNIMAREQSPNYINSGHMLISRSLFDEIGGFNERLTTGEDHEICKRASSSGAKLQENRKLKAYHCRYPKTITEFIRREYWHGSQDFQNLKSVNESKLAKVLIINLITITTALLLSIILKTILPIGLYLIAASIATIIMTKSKFKKVKISELIQSSLVMSIYLTARTASLANKGQHYWRKQ
ncbi:MAG: glycosyltransferase [Marinobacter sp.]|nr:glycosyltransferase [Marinobacter sp.]